MSDKSKKIICAVRTEEDFSFALCAAPEVIFDLNPDLFTLQNRVEAAHARGKRLFIHMDLATGIGKDKSGILYVKQAGVDGIISTRVNMIKMARESGIFTVQRFFAVDSQSIDTTVDSVRSAKPDMAEIMPGTQSKIVARLSEELALPIIAGGLIETEDEVSSALAAGAVSVSTGKRELWG